MRVEAVQVYPSKKEWIDRWLAEIPPHAIFAGIGNTPDEKVTQLKAVGQTAPNFPAASMELDPVAELPSAVTDAEGKVEIRGLGHERLVLLKIVGPGIAAAKLYALTHPTKTIEFDRGFPRRVFPIYGSEFDYIAAPGTVVTGIVRDEETKKPVEGAIVASDSLEGVRTDSGGKLSATTDVEGRYRLDGLSTNRRITITVTGPKSAYLETDIEVRRSRPVEPIREDITLRRGVWAVGRAFNIKTGQPVAATLFYTPFRSNEFARKSRRSGVTGFLDDVPAGHTNDDGRFRIPVLAGRGVIALRCASGDFVPAFGAAKSGELSDRKTEVATFDTLVPRWFDAVAEVDIKPNLAELRVDLPVDPGQDVVVRFVDPRGKPLAGVRGQGLMMRRTGVTKTDTITIPALSPDETRIMWMKHEGTGLTRFLRFKLMPGEVERTITLEAPAVLTGRLVSPAGEPLRDVSIDCSYDTGYNSAGGFPQARTDAQGRFRYEIPGGGPFHVASRSGTFFSLARSNGPIRRAGRLRRTRRERERPEAHDRDSKESAKTNPVAGRRSDDGQSTLTLAPCASVPLKLGARLGTRARHCEATRTLLFHAKANQTVTATPPCLFGEGVARSTARSDCCVPEKAFATAAASVGRSARGPIPAN